MRVTFDNDTSKYIYLIANNKNLNKKILNIIKKNDIVILFNDSMWTDYFKNYKNKFLFMRHNSNAYGQWYGYNLAEKNIFLKTYFINGYPRNINYKKFKYSKELINNKNNIYNVGYPKNKSPTTGFWCYFILKDIYPNYNITLMGFNPTANNYHPWSGHDVIYEDKYLKEHDIKKIN